MGCDYDVVHFIERVVGDVDTVDQDENETDHVTNAGQPFCYVVAERGLVVDAVDRVRRVISAGRR